MEKVNMDAGMKGVQGLKMINIDEDEIDRIKEWVKNHPMFSGHGPRFAIMEYLANQRGETYYYQYWSDINHDEV